MILFYANSISIKDKNFTFGKSDSMHIAKVIRKNTGALVTITNGTGLEWTGKLTLVTPKKVEATKIKSIQHEIPKKAIHLAIAPTKNNTRMEWLVEKLTELGITSITPLLCEHSERKVMKTERLIKIAIASLKQSQQFYLPQIQPLTSFQKHLKSIEYPALLAHCDSLPKISLSEYQIKSDKILLYIGPEGDFSRDEIDLATSMGITPVSLGKQRFRTETAGLLGCHSIFQKYNN